MDKVSKEAVLFVAQGAYSGRSPVAPGTAGTIVGVLLFLAVRNLAPVPYGILCVLLCVIGAWAAGEAEEILGRKDHRSIVIDEIAGYLISLFLVPPAWGYIISGFFLFRFFDIVKPWPLFRLQDVRGGLGVMLDDIGAGIYTNIVLQIAAYYKLL